MKRRALARRVAREAADNLGIAIASMLNLMNPTLVVLGGGLARLGELLLEPLRETVRISFCCSPLSPTACRTAVSRLLSVESETVRPSQTPAIRSSLLTTRSRFSTR